MIKYQLICDLTHEFEGWFQTSAAFDAQNQAGLVTCPVCDSVKVRRALMTPNLASPKRRRDDVRRLPMARNWPPASWQSGGHQRAIFSSRIWPNRIGACCRYLSRHQPHRRPRLARRSRSLRQLQRKVKSECRDVGTEFATEVRKMHYGDSEPENIYGHSSAEERESLADEGIDIVTLPWLPPEH